MLERYSDGSTAVVAQHLTNPELAFLTDFTGMSAAAGVDNLQRAADDLVPRGAVMPKVEFLPQAVANSDNFISGFDPPMRKDENPPTVGTPPPDEVERAEWWTSLGRSNPPGVSGIDYTKNDFLKVVFPTAADAKMYCLIVTTHSTQITVSPKVFTQQETPLEIRATAAAAGNATIQDAIIEVRRELNPGDALPEPDMTNAVVATLKVKLMPVCNLPLRVRYIQDNDSAGTHLPIGVPTPAEIAFWANRAFRQCGVHFTALEPATVAHTDIDYDLRSNNSPQPDGKLHSVAVGNAEMMPIMDAPGLYDGKLNVVIVHQRGPGTANIDDTVFDGIALRGIPGAPGSWLRRVLVYTRPFTSPTNGALTEVENFLHCCAHELGHALDLAHRGRNLSKVPHELRQPPLWSDNPAIRSPAKTHDIGHFPLRRWRIYAGHHPESKTFWMQGLMWPRGPIPRPSSADDFTKPRIDESKWLRHEDWHDANVRARVLNNPP